MPKFEGGFGGVSKKEWEATVGKPAKDMHDDELRRRYKSEQELTDYFLRSGELAEQEGKEGMGIDEEAQHFARLDEFAREIARRELPTMPTMEERESELEEIDRKKEALE